MHRYDYRAGVTDILSETMTGHSVLLLASARGAARAARRERWGMHVACHVHFTPEDERHNRMFFLNLALGYLAGASLIEDEEAGLATVHSFPAGPDRPHARPSGSAWWPGSRAGRPSTPGPPRPRWRSACCTDGTRC